MFMIILSWVVALLSLMYFFTSRLEKIDPTTFSFSFWIADNINLLTKGLLSVFILMIIATNTTTIKLVTDAITNWHIVFRIVPYPLLAGLTIGLLNYSLLEWYRKFSKKKIDNIQ